MAADVLIAACHRPQSSSFLGLPYRILNMNPQKGTTLGLWVTAVTPFPLAKASEASRSARPASAAKEAVATFCHRLQVYLAT